MSKFVAFALIGAALSAPAFAAPAPSPLIHEMNFTRDGETYHLTTADMGRYTRISGHDEHGHTFNFRQSGTRVTGYYDDNYVDFIAPRAADPAEVAAR